MKIIDRYIMVTIIVATLIVLLTLLGMQCLIIFLQQLDVMGQGDYHLWQSVSYVVMQLPGDFYQFIPMAGLIGSLAGLGVLASNSELVVMRASGVSLARITVVVLIAAVLLMLVATPLGEGIGPGAHKISQLNQAIALHRGKALETAEGIWVRDGDSFLHIQKVLPGARLEDVTRYVIDDQHRVTLTSHAKTGRYDHGRWVFNDIEQSQLQPDQIKTQSIKQAYWPLTFDPKMIGMNEDIGDVNEMNLMELHTYAHYLKQSGLQDNRFELSFWQRVFQPLATIVMIFLGVPFIFGPLRSVTMGLRILSGVVVGFAFYILNQMFGPMSLVYDFPPMLAALVPTALFAGLGIMMLQRAR